MDQLQSFETAPITEAHEAEVGSISEAIEAKSAEHADRGAVIEKKEIVKDVLSQQAASSAQSQISTDDSLLSEADKIKAAQKSEQFNRVMSYTQKHGPLKASLMVKKIGDPWLEDQFHDAIIRLHDELIQKKQLKNE